MSHIQLPQPRKNWVKRQHALDLLYAALDSRLILVVAGAGYGKTGLLAQFAKTEGFTFSWLTLDESEQDVRSFGEALASSLSQCFPGFGQQTMQLLKSAGAIEQNIGLLVRTFARELSDHLTQPLCMVLDDFHVVESSAPVIQFVDRLINELPEEAHLIISSRNLPPLQLGLLIAQQQVAALGQSMLRLDLDETRQLIASLNGVNLVDIDDATSNRAYSETEGWLVGLLMSNHIGRMREAQIGLGAPRAVDLLSNYLLVKVLQDLPAPLQDFLLRSCILDELSIPFCSNVIGWTDTRDWILEIERRNLFIQPIGPADGVGEAETSYRYHPLFREFLLQRLREDDPIRYTQLQHDVANAYERTDNIERAIRHYLSGGWSTDVMRAAETHAPEFLERGRYRTVLEWLSRLDAIAPGARAERHLLWQFEIWAHLNLGEDTQAMAAVDQLDDLYQRTGDLGRRDVLNIRRGMLLYRASDFENSLACAHTVIHSVYPQPIWTRVEAHRIAAMSLIELGRLREALDYITRAEELTQNWGRAGYEALARSKLTRAGILQNLGDTSSALRSEAEALSLAEDIHEDGLLAESLIDMAEMLLFGGSQDGLVEMARQGLSQAESTGNQGVRITGLITLAQILMAQGRCDDAHQAGSGALAFARQITQSNERGVLLFLSLIGLAHVMCRHALRETAPEKRATLLQQALGLSREAAAIADVSQSVRMRLAAHARLGAVQVIQGDYQLGASSLSYTELIRGQFNDNAVGQAYVWQLMAAWMQARPDISRVQFLLEQINQLVSLRRQTYFIQAEGETVWQTYQTLRAAPDLQALSALQRQLDNQVEQLSEPATSTLEMPTQIKLVQHDLRVYGFGPGRVYRVDDVINTSQWGWSIPRELFFYMLTVRQSSRAQIGTSFWPDANPGSMQSSFHNAKCAIKNAIGKPAMVYVNGSYAINPELDYLYDVASFESLIAKVSHVASDDGLNDLLAAANLYQADFLLDFSSEWVEQVRTELALKFIDCCCRAGTLALALNQPDVVLETLDRAAQHDPLNEEVARLRMKAQWRSGKRHSALDTYSSLKEALQREMGICPDTDTEKLLASLKSS